MTGPELLTCEEMAEADRLSVAAGVPSLALMESAGRAVAREALRMAPAGARVAVLCGPGNNGGDGFVVARLLAETGYSIRLALLGERSRLRGDADTMATRWQGATEPWSAAQSLVDWADLVVDAMFGAGLSRPLDGEASAVVEHLQHSGKPVLAVDVPSGLDGNTGMPWGTVVRASRTVTFFRRKPGHVLQPGRELCGQVTVADIGTPDGVLRQMTVRTLANGALRPLWTRNLLPHVDAHKYRRGHALIISGPAHATGAARLGARGALRAGAGLVSIASSPAAVAINAAQSTAVMIKPFDGPGGLADVLSDRRINAALIGPGAGVGGATAALVETVLRSAVGVVLDADALTSFAPNPDWLWQLLAQRREVGAHPLGHLAGEMEASGADALHASATVLTPHDGELERLFGPLPGTRLERARTAARIAHAVVLLKGPDTVIAAPNGIAAINENAPPWLATAGSGDVLAGIVTGLLAQGMAPFMAASAAVWLHGECAAAVGPGLVAEDLPEALPQVLAKIMISGATGKD